MRCGRAPSWRPSPHGDPVRADDLAAGQQLPVAFLERILGDLRRGGVVVSVRGRSGGYRLARPADEITLADVIRAVDGPLVTVRDERPTALEYGGSAEALLEVWVALRVSVRDVLDQVTLAGLVSGRAPAARARAGRPRGRLGQPLVHPRSGIPACDTGLVRRLIRSGLSGVRFSTCLGGSRARSPAPRPRRARRPAGRRRLGMAYGVTSTTLLLAIGTNPAAASATVHLSEIGTTLVSGVSHWRFGNVDWKVVLRIGVPGAVGAFLGATVLSRLATDLAKPVMSTILLALGVYILVRFTLFGLRKDRLGLPLRKRFLAPLGLFAGFVDATGGGGWGPVGTPALLASGRIEPRKVIGSIDTSEFLVALAASLGFLFALGSQGINPSWVLALLIGGVIAAPIAAWLVRKIPPASSARRSAALIVLTNVRTLIRSDWIGLGDTPTEGIVLGAIALVWAAAITWSVRAYRNDLAAEADTLRPPTPRGGAGRRRPTVG